MTSHPLRRRYSVTLSGVTNAGWTEGSLTVPERGLLRRIRVEVSSGSPTNVLLQVRETSGSTGGLPVVADYSATPPPLDDAPTDGIWYDVRDPTTIPATGTIYVAAQTDVAGASDLVVELTIEPGQ